MSVSNKTGILLSVCLSPVSCTLSVSNMFSSSFWMISDSLTKSNITEDILSVSNTYTNGATLPVSLLEQSGALAPLKF